MVYGLIPFVLVIGAFARRIAGGYLNQAFGLAGGATARVMGDTPARGIFAALVAACGFLGGAPWTLAVALVPAWFIGTTLGNYNSIAMGRAQTSFAHDFFGMSLHALESVAFPLAAVAAYYAYFAHTGHLQAAYMVGLTMLAAPLYALGWIISGKDAGNMALPVGFQSGFNIGEALWGASTALGCFLTFTP